MTDAWLQESKIFVRAAETKFANDTKSRPTRFKFTLVFEAVGSQCFSSIYIKPHYDTASWHSNAKVLLHLSTVRVAVGWR